MVIKILSFVRSGTVVCDGEAADDCGGSGVGSHDAGDSWVLCVAGKLTTIEFRFAVGVFLSRGRRDFLWNIMSTVLPSNT